MLIKHKKANEQHINFIHHSWIRSAFLSGLAASELARLLPALLPHIHIAYADLDGHETVLGWLCAIQEPAPCVVYAYVKEPFRRIGAFNGLLAHAFPEHPGILQYCYVGGNLTRLLASKYRAVFNPFFLVGSSRI